jgi:hypothetical protein
MRARSLTGSSGADSPSWPGTPGRRAARRWVQRGGDVPWLRVAVAGLPGLLLALRRVPVVARALTAPGMVNRLKLPHSFWVAEGTGFLLTMASAICPRCSRYPRAPASPMSAVFLYVPDPALEGTSGERGTATLRASQHAHGTGSAVAPDDGQALVLD